MLISGRSIDDFKTERKGISPPLPTYLRLLPIIFYLAIVATIGLNGLFFLRFGQEAQKKEAAIKKKSELDVAVKDAVAERQALEGRTKKASDILDWVDTTRPLQPLVVDIARSILPESSLVELRFDREQESPAKIQFSMKLSSDNPRQLDETLERIAAQRYRLFSPQQSLAQGEIDYKATILWQDPNRPEPVAPTTTTATATAK